MDSPLNPEAVEAAARVLSTHRYVAGSEKGSRPAFELCSCGVKVAGSDRSNAADALARHQADALTAALPLLTVKPDRDTIARVIGDTRWGPGEWVGVPDVPLLRQADAVLAVLPGRTEADIRTDIARRIFGFEQEVQGLLTREPTNPRLAGALSALQHARDIAEGVSL